MGVVSVVGAVVAVVASPSSPIVAINTVVKKHQ